jgi:hypothetical protein
MTIVAIFPPTYGSLGDIETPENTAGQPGCAICLIFASGDPWLIDRARLQGVGNAQGGGAWFRSTGTKNSPIGTSLTGVADDAFSKVSGDMKN